MEFARRSNSTGTGQIVFVRTTVDVSFTEAAAAGGNAVGRFRAANHPLRRADGTFLPDLQGITDTEDGATIVLEADRGIGLSAQTLPSAARID